MNAESRQLDILEILAGICNSKTFWAMQKNMKGEGFLLSYLMEQGGKCTPGRLADLLNVSGARITAILTALQGKGFIERCGNPADKRRVTVYLTESGRGFVSDLREQVFSCADEICNVLGEQDTEELIRIAKKLILFEKGANAAQKGA